MKTTPSVLRMKLVGAKPTAKVEGLQAAPGKSNYFIGNDPTKWREGVSNYAKVQYRSVYPGIDMVVLRESRAGSSTTLIWLPEPIPRRSGLR